MNTASLLTRGTVWLALLCYVGTVILQARSNPRLETLARLLWIAGCILFLAHVASAFHFYHQWSHTLAAEDTRQDTLERTGLNFDGGLWFNYLFALTWLVDCIGCLRGGRCLSERNTPWRIMLHSFFLFMIINATVVFGHGLARPAGLLLGAVAGAALILRKPFRA